MERPELAGDAARTRSRSRAKARFSLSVPESRPPQSQISLKSRHSCFIDREAAGEIGIKTHGGVHLFNLLSSMSRKAVANTDGSRSVRQKAPIS
jgi:hypothetical protein